MSGKKVLSFVLFGDKDRYWSALPTSFISHQIAFPEFTIRLHVTKALQNHRLYPLVRKLQDKYGLIEVDVIDRICRRTEPTIWRLFPLWDQNVKYVFCRDIDAMPIKDEIRAMRSFIDLGFWIHGIRSYKLHTAYLMAGMCGFNCKKLREAKILPKSFKDYSKATKNVRNGGRWGCDQFALQNYFYVRHPKRHLIMKKTLDTVLGDAPKRIGDFRATILHKRMYSKIDLSYIKDEKLLKISQKLQPFAGAPILRRGTLKYLPRILKMTCSMSEAIKEIIEKNLFMKEYYLPEKYQK